MAHKYEHVSTGNGFSVINGTVTTQVIDQDGNKVAGSLSGEVTWTGGLATLAIAATGVLSTDRVIATIQTAPTEAAYIASAEATADTVTLTLSTANTSNDAVIAYEVVRT